MPRPQNGKENVRYVQELADVDGPFQSPVCINFKDISHLELPPLIWNKCDVCPKKMKVTNSGHTVIVSAKWKCERPYLTGGPLEGNYVFSQVHFHWGPNNLKGSEHTVDGEVFPLEMHVVHFKSEYLNQESALKEKDGMVVVVYLFKLQETTNHSLKRFLNTFQEIQCPNSSKNVDPRSLSAVVNPFTDDYFMYWGSVVTTTCAHLILWFICREPFGISCDQIDAFRNLLDSSNKPIRRNYREIQPLHRRNVFHVNASDFRDSAMLPVKNIIGCYCKGNPGRRISLRDFNKEENRPGGLCRCKESIHSDGFIDPIAEMNEDDKWKNAESIYEFTVRDIHGNYVKLDKYRGLVLLIVNIASYCRLTTINYRELVALETRFVDTTGFKVLAFPCNQFGNQEPGTNDDIMCYAKKMNAKFDMFDKIDVNGEDASPLWKYLKFKTEERDITWNFTKFIIDRGGHVAERHEPDVDPLLLVQNIEHY